VAGQAVVQGPIQAFVHHFSLARPITNGVIPDRRQSIQLQQVVGGADELSGKLGMLAPVEAHLAQAPDHLHPI